MGRCRFAKICRLYNPEHVTCEKDGGDYYGPGRMGGCGRDLAQKGEKSTYYKKLNEEISKE